jgi:hypothetical protein
MPLKTGISRRVAKSRPVCMGLKRYLSRGTDYLKEKFSRLRAQVKKAIKESRESFFQSLGSTLKINPKRFYGLSSKLSRVLEVYPIQSRAFVRTILKVDNRHRHHIILHQCLTSTFIRYTPPSGNNHPQLNLVHLLQYQVFHQLIFKFSKKFTISPLTLKKTVISLIIEH